MSQAGCEFCGGRDCVGCCSTCSSAFCPSNQVKGCVVRTFRVEHRVRGVGPFYEGEKFVFVHPAAILLYFAESLTHLERLGFEICEYEAPLAHAPDVWGQATIHTSAQPVRRWEIREYTFSACTTGDIR